MRYIGFDLDGTLAHHAEGDSIDHVGAPIGAMVELARKYIAEGTPVRIITARVAPEYEDADEQRAMISAWAREHLGTDVVVQAHKCGRMAVLYDDRARGVCRNAGVLETKELEDIYNDLFWVVPEAQDENGEEMTAQRKIQVLARSHVDLANLLEYDRRYGIESDAYARYFALIEDDYPIVVEPNTGGASFFVGVREARCLAASLLRAADEAEKTETRTT